MRRIEMEAEVCVVGGGMAGICAAIASARRGAKTILVHERPVLGGNASSEIRMWICGAKGAHNKETGILEEIQLENNYRNAPLNYSIWDSVLYEKVFCQPNLTTLLNTSVCDGHAVGRRLESIKAWQMTSQSWVHIHSRFFIDCSGDSILAPISNAEYRRGREARTKYNEDIQPSVADNHTMGNSLLLQLRRTDHDVPFVPPIWAYRFNSPADIHHRLKGGAGNCNFWWVELGGLNDTVGDAESIRHELYKIIWGIWDYVKNRSPKKDKARKWEVEWVGALPGKRESRRYQGEYTLTQNDIRAGSEHFTDVVAYGGWPMDDHHPAGILYPLEPTIYHQAPSPYDIPWRCLYSANIHNLLCAGRNISVSHAALSSTRVMGTCALLGQAAGTGAALCVAESVMPSDLTRSDHMRKLQAWLQDDDVWLPGHNRATSSVMNGAEVTSRGQNITALTNGQDRDLPDIPGLWRGQLGEPITIRWQSKRQVGGIRLICDSNLRNSKRMPSSYPQKANRQLVPRTLLRQYRVQARSEDGKWLDVAKESNNYQRLVRISLNVRTDGLRLIPEDTWGSNEYRLFGLEATERQNIKLPNIKEVAFQDIIKVKQTKTTAQLKPVVTLPQKSVATTSIT